MDWDPKLSLSSRLLIQQALRAAEEALKPGWRGDATRETADLEILLEHVKVGLVGLAPLTTRGQKFLVYQVMGGSEDPTLVCPPLCIPDMMGVCLVSIPVWLSILPLAIEAGLAIEIMEPPSGPALLQRWRKAVAELPRFGEGT